MDRAEVNSTQFWKHRIDTAQKEHYSVYVTTEEAWKKIGEIHKNIIKQECGGKILDAGCGYGRMSEWVHDYTGVDFSPDFIEIARLKYPDKKFMVADLEALPFKDKEFDWAVCISIKHMIEGNLGKEAWQKMETELKRVAQKVLILEYTEPERYWII